MPGTEETAVDLADRMPAGAYRIGAPTLRSGLLFAELQHETNGKRFEGGITPADDILSLHRSDFTGRAWRGGRLLHDGPINRSSISLVKSGIRSDVELEGFIDIVQVFVPRATIGGLAAEMIGEPVEPVIDGWIRDRRLERLAEHAVRAIAGGDAAGFLAADTMALELAARLISRHAGDRAARRVHGRIHRGGLSPWQMRRALDLMDSALSRELPLLELAQEVGLSSFHFLRAFHRETGLTPHQWLLRRRIAQAKALLARSDLSLAEIAAEVGYSSQSAMAALFRRLAGASPGEWRRRAGR